MMSNPTADPQHTPGLAPQERKALRESFNPAFFMRRYAPTGIASADDAFEFYLAGVQTRHFDPNPEFFESGYLLQYPEVARGVAEGLVYCGYHHWQVHGRREGRQPGRRLTDLLFDASPYSDFSPDPSRAEDMQGWGSDHSIFERTIRHLRPRRIIEVGTWKGRSAINMAQIAMAAGLSLEIICIDTWLGSAEHWFNRTDPNYYQSLRVKNGSPRIYETFLQNVLSHRLEHIITPLRADSRNAYRILDHFGIKADLIYIDASHDYDSVLADLRMYFDLLAPEGVIFGDDYPPWPGVKQAVDEFVASMPDCDFSYDIGKFVLSKTAIPEIALPQRL